MVENDRTRVEIQPRENERHRRVRSLVTLASTAFAGFNAFSTFTAWVSFGAFGAWIVQHWVPWTRKFWGFVVDLLPIHIELTAAERDSLTAVAFFAPAAITATIFRTSWTVLARRFSGMRNAVAIVATSAIALFGIAGVRVLLDGIELLQFAEFSDAQIWFAVGVVLVVLAVVAAYTLFQIVQTLTRHSWRDDLISSVAVTFTMGAFIAIAIAGLAIADNWNAVLASLGFLRMFAIVLVIAAVTVSARFAPERTLQICAVVVLLVLVGLVFEFVERMGASIEAQPDVV